MFCAPTMKQPRLVELFQSTICPQSVSLRMSFSSASSGVLAFTNYSARSVVRSLSSLLPCGSKNSRSWKTKLFFQEEWSFFYGLFATHMLRTLAVHLCLGTSNKLRIAALNPKALDTKAFSSSRKCAGKAKHATGPG